MILYTRPLLAFPQTEVGTQTSLYTVEVFFDNWYGVCEKETK